MEQNYQKSVQNYQMMTRKNEILKKAYTKHLNNELPVYGNISVSLNSSQTSVTRSLSICGFAPFVIAISKHALSVLLFYIVN